jgi:hypothetical protein
MPEIVNLLHLSEVEVLVAHRALPVVCKEPDKMNPIGYENMSMVINYLFAHNMIGDYGKKWRGGGRRGCPGGLKSVWRC